MSEAAPKPAPQIVKALHPRDLMETQFAYARMSATLPPGVEIKDALNPAFWVHVCDKFAKQVVTGEPDRAGAIIEVRTADHAFYAELYVRAVMDKVGLIVELLGDPVYFGPKAVETGNGYETRWNVGKRAYDIIRHSDRTVVATDLKTKEAVAEWIAKA